MFQMILKLPGYSQGQIGVSNCRSISVLSVISKILEKAIYVQVEEYLKENISYNFQ